MSVIQLKGLDFTKIGGACLNPIVVKVLLTINLFLPNNLIFDPNIP